MVVNGSLSKTAVNGAAGAHSQLSGLVVAVLTIVTLLFLTGLFEELPEATLAAVVIAAVVELVDIGALRRLDRVYAAPGGSTASPPAPTSSPPSRRCSACSSSTRCRGSSSASGCRCAAPLPGLRPHVAVLGRLAAWAGRSATSPDSPTACRSRGSSSCESRAALFFANADTIRESVRARARRACGRSCSTPRPSRVDVTAVGMLAELSEDLEREGVQLLFARDIGQVRDVLRRADEEGPTQRIYPTVEAAVEAAKAGGPPTRPPARARRRGCPLAERVRCRLGPVAQTELAVDPAHVVAGGLLADDESSGDLGIREPFAEEREHLALAARERLGLRRRSSRPAEGAQERGGLVRLARSPEGLEGAERIPCLVSSQLGACSGEEPGQPQAHLGLLERHPELDEEVERGLERRCCACIVAGERNVG